MFVHPEVLCVGPGWEAGSSSPGVWAPVCVFVGWGSPLNLGEQYPVTHPHQVTALPWSCLLLFLHPPSLPVLLFPKECAGSWGGPTAPQWDGQGRPRGTARSQIPGQAHGDGADS